MSKKFKISAIRKSCYDYNRKFIINNGEDMDDFLRYPYTAIKSRLYIELSSVFVFFYQFFNLSPNILTLTYALLGPTCVLLVLLETNTSYIAVCFYFFLVKGVLDWSDGTYARLSKKTSTLGALLDPWGADVNGLCFRICVAVFCYQQTSFSSFIFTALGFSTLAALDFRSFVLRSYPDLKPELTPKMSSYGKGIRNKFLDILKFLILLPTDGRARAVDSFILIILMEKMLYNSIVFAEFLIFAMLVSQLVKFLFGFYLSYNQIKNKRY